MKRIFSFFLAFVLVLSLVPFMGTEAMALGLDEKGSYKIKFRPGEHGTGSTETIEYEPDEKAILPNAEEFGFEADEGYEFSGWKIGSKTYSAGSSFKGEEGTYTATAQWKKEGDSSSSSSSKDESDEGKTYKVTYYAGDGEGSPVRKTYDYGENFKLISNPFEYEGYTFVGWGYGDDVYDPGDEVKAPNRDVSFTAEWEKDKIELGEKVESISIEELPDKTTYKVGEKLDTTGLEIKVKTSSGNKIITSGFEVSPSGEFKTAGTVEITVTYKQKTATFDVTVKAESSSTATSSKPSSSSAPSSSAPASSKPSSSSAPSSSVPSTSSSSEESSVPESSASSSSVPEAEPEVFRPVTLAFSIDGDIPVTKIEFVLEEEIGENPTLNILPIDTYSVTDEAAEKFIADGDTLAAFDLSLLTDGKAYEGPAAGTVNYNLNGTQASAASNYEAYVLAMVHTVNIGKYDGDYYMTDGENTYLYTPETDFKSAVANVKLVEEDDVYRLVIKDVSGLSSFAYKASENTIVEVNLVPSRDAENASIEVSSLSPILLVQIEVGEGKASAGIPVWVWIVIAAVVLIVAVLVVLFLVNRSNEQKRYSERTERRSSHSHNTSSGITGFDDEE